MSDYSKQYYQEKATAEVERLARDLSECFERDTIECVCGHCYMPHTVQADTETEELFRNLRLALVQLDLARASEHERLNDPMYGVTK